jgi:hypothetical protein
MTLLGEGRVFSEERTGAAAAATTTTTKSVLIFIYIFTCLFVSLLTTYSPNRAQAASLLVFLHHTHTLSHTHTQ